MRFLYVLALNCYVQVGECEWVSCFNPPLVPHLGIYPLWDGLTTTPFGGNMSYVCEEDGTYFEPDRDMAKFKVECLPGGRWDLSVPWPKCVKSKE